MPSKKSRGGPTRVNAPIGTDAMTVIRAGGTSAPTGSALTKAIPQKGVGILAVGGSTGERDWEASADVRVFFPNGMPGKQAPKFVGWDNWVEVFKKNAFVSACVRLIAESLVSGGWRLAPYKTGGEISSVSRKILEEFFASFHPYYTLTEFLRAEFESLVLASRCYIEVCKNDLGNPAAMWSLAQGTIWPIPQKSGMFDEKRAFCQVVKDRDKPIEFGFDQILWLRLHGMRFNSLNPASPIELLTLPADSTIESEKYIHSFFKSGGKMGMILENPDWTKAQAIEARRYYENMYTDSAKGHQMLILYDKTQVKDPPKISGDWARFVDVQQFDGRKVCGVFNVDPRLIAYAGEGNLGGKGEREHLLQEFHINNINPKKEIISELITRQLIQQGFGIFDARFELVPFESTMEVGSKQILASTYESMKRTGLFYPDKPEDVNLARKAIDPEMVEITGEEIAAISQKAMLATAVSQAPSLLANPAVAKALGLEPVDPAAAAALKSAEAPSAPAKPGPVEPSDDESAPVEPTEDRYDPDQPRDDDGKFGSGGGGSSSSSGDGSKGKTLKEQGYSDAHVNKLIKEKGVKGAMQAIKNAEKDGDIAHTSSTKTMTAPERDEYVTSAKAAASESVTHIEEASSIAKQADKVAAKVEAAQSKLDDIDDDEPKAAAAKEKLDAHQADLDDKKKALASSLKKAQYKLAKAKTLADDAEFGGGDDEEDAAGAFDPDGVEHAIAVLESDEIPDPDEIAAVAKAVKIGLDVKPNKSYKVKRRSEERRAPKTAAEKRTPWSDIETRMTSWTDRTESAIIEPLKEIIQKTALKLGDLLAQSKGGITEVSKMNILPGAGPLAVDFRKSLKGYFRDSEEAAREELARIAKDVGVARAVGDSIVESSIGDIDDFIELAGKNEFDSLYQRITSKAKSLFMSAIRGGWTRKETVDKIAREVTTVAENDLSTIVRTYSTDFFSLARQRAADESGIVSGYEYSSILDDRTTEVCEVLDMLQVKSSDPDLDRIRPPNHYNCRATFTFVLKGETVKTDKRKLQRGMNLIATRFGGKGRD